MMQAYAEYKDSGVDWLGEIPAGWDVKRVQDVATYNDDVVDEIAYKRREIKYVDISSVSSVTNSYQFEEMLFSSAPSRAKRLINSGDTIFSTVRPYLKAVATIQNPESNLVVSTGFAVARPRKETNARFLGYLLRNEAFIDEVSANSVGASYPAINASDLFKIKTPFTDTSVQTAIADFLDDKTAKIEALVGIKRRQIELLEERKQILIQNAVTKGLNPDAPMKDSGVEWIGTIPAHWEMKPAKYLFFEVDERSESGDEELLSVSHMTGVTPRSEKTVSMFLAEDYSGSKICVEDDLVFNIMWAWMGALGVSAQLGIVSPSYAVFRQLKSQTFNPVYLEMLMQSLGYIEHYNKVSTGLHSSRLRFYAHMLLSMKVGYPTFEEQERIVQFLAKETGKISKAISVLENQITKLNEYKTTLINAAVTGKIRVT